MMLKKRVLVTGATGFIGRELCRHLRMRQNIVVVKAATLFSNLVLLVIYYISAQKVVFCVDIHRSDLKQTDCNRASALDDLRKVIEGGYYIGCGACAAYNS